MSEKKCARCGNVHHEAGSWCALCKHERRKRYSQHGFVKRGNDAWRRNREVSRRESVVEVVSEWNELFPSGTRVRIRRNDGSVCEAVTVGEAELIAGVPVVMVEGDVFCTYQLSRLEVA